MKKPQRTEAEERQVYLDVVRKITEVYMEAQLGPAATASAALSALWVQTSGFALQAAPGGQDHARMHHHGKIMLMSEILDLPTAPHRDIVHAVTLGAIDARRRQMPNAEHRLRCVVHGDVPLFDDEWRQTEQAIAAARQFFQLIGGGQPKIACPICITAEPSKPPAECNYIHTPPAPATVAPPAAATSPATPSPVPVDVLCGQCQKLHAEGACP